MVQQDQSMSPKWPKRKPTLTDEQRAIRDDFMNYWLTELPQRYGVIERFNHKYPLRSIAAGGRTLEIGAGSGAHVAFEDTHVQEYVALELRDSLATEIRERFPHVRVLVGDCQKHIECPDAHFDRVLAIHVLEHLPDLPAALDEIRRVLKPGGRFSVVIPCEGGLAYSLARSISAKRLFEKRYGQSYDWCIASEHLSRPEEIVAELEERFRIVHRAFFPLILPVFSLNLVVGLTLVADGGREEGARCGDSTDSAPGGGL